MNYCSFLVLLTFLCSFAMSQEFDNSSSQDVIRLSLTDCITTALEQSPDMAGAVQGVELAKLALQQAKAQYLPTLGLDFSYGLNIDQNGGFSTGELSGGIFVNYDIFGGLYRKENVERAKVSYQMALLQKKQAELELTGSVVKTFYDILKNRHRLQLTQQSVDNAEKNLRQTELRLQTGQVDSTDFSYAKLALQENESDLTLAIHALGQSQTELFRILGIKSYGSLELIAAQIDPVVLKTIQEYIDFAQAHRLDLQIAEQNLKIAEVTLKYAKLGKLPQIDLYTTGNVPITGEGNNTSFTLTPNLYWEFFDAGNVHFQIEYAKQNLYSVQTALQVLKTKVVSDIQKAYDAVIESQQEVELAGQRAILAKSSLRKSEIRFHGGEISEFEYQQVKQELDKSEMQKADAEYNMILAEAELQHATGMEILKIKS
jgi:outer membrane protein